MIGERTDYDLLLLRDDILKQNIDLLPRRIEYLNQRNDLLAQRKNLRSAIIQQEMLIDNISNNREFLLSVSLDLLNNIISNSETAISIADIYPELEVNVKSLKSIINTSSVEYQRIKNMD